MVNKVLKRHLIAYKGIIFNLELMIEAELQKSFMKYLLFYGSKSS